MTLDAVTEPPHDEVRAGSLARSTAVMSIGTVVSRLTGVVRLAIIAAALGIAETRLTDTYNLANTVPNIIYELVLGGVITSVFVPLFVELLEKEERERAWEVMSAILNVSLVVMSVIAILVMLAAPWIGHFYASRLGGDAVEAQADVITFLLRLFAPQIVFYALYFIVAGILNAHKRFAAPMFTPILNNLVAIAVFVIFLQIYGAVSLRTVTTTQLLIIGLGTTASVAPMALGLLPQLRRLGRYRATMRMDHPSLKKLARLSVFAIGFVVVNQIGYVVIQWLANEQQGGYTAYISAFTFYLLPIGLIVWSLTTALVPDMSEEAVNERWDGFRDRLSLGVRATVFLMLPASVGYFILARPIVEVLLEHGVTTARSTELVAGVLRFLVLGLLQFSLYQLFVRGFYATQDTRTPFLINCAVIALNMAINVPMFEWLGVRGLAAGEAIAYTIGIAIQAVVLSRRSGGLQLRRILASGLRAAAAAAAMGAIVWASWRATDGLVGGGLAGDLVTLAVPVALGAASYFALASLLGAEEAAYVRGLVARRFPSRA